MKHLGTNEAGAREGHELAYSIRQPFRTLHWDERNLDERSLELLG